MGFGSNPHVAKAEAAELKAQEARDAASESRAWREAAHLWERAEAREAQPKKKALYEQAAARARAQADAPSNPVGKAALTAVAGTLRLVPPASTTPQ